jgi:hypothetical protein
VIFVWPPALAVELCSRWRRVLQVCGIIGLIIFAVFLIWAAIELLLDK